MCLLSFPADLRKLVHSCGRIMSLRHMHTATACLHANSCGITRYFLCTPISSSHAVTHILRISATSQSV